MSAPELAPDPSVPHRDVLLDPRALAARLDPLLGAAGPLGIERVEPARVKYRVGRGMGLVLRVHAAGAVHLVSARAFAPGRGARAFERALATVPPATGPVRPLAYDPELETAFWTFPHDRRIRTLSVLDGPSPELARVVGAPGTPELVAYVPEKAATARCRGADGQTLAYVKVYSDDGGERTRAVHDALGATVAAAGGRLRVPRALGYDAGRQVLATQPVAGDTLAALGSGVSRSRLAALGAALATLHGAPPPPQLRRFERLTPERIERAAELIGMARPDVARAAARLAGALAASFTDDGVVACLHGDVNRKNAIFGPDTVTLIDLDDVRLGPPAADLGSLLAALRYQCCVGSLSAAGERALASELLGGYRSVRELPDPRSLAWHTAAALLGERALRAVTRIRRPGLARLDELVTAARDESPSRAPAAAALPAPAPVTPPATARPALLLHCQHSMGLGHLTRSLALAHELARRFDVVLLSGGQVPRHVTPPPGVEIVQLPPLTRELGGGLVSGDGRRSVDRVKVLRREMVVDAVRRVRPAIVVVELFPFGRRAFAGEILALIEEARALPGGPALVASSVRDILVGRGGEQAAYDERACRLANANLDAILVHADPRFARLEESFAPRTRLRVPVHYTGFVTRRGAASPPDGRERRVVVSAGGGSVGAPLLSAAVAAQPELWAQEGVALRLIAGPFLPEPAWRDLRARAAGWPGLELRRAVPDLGAELARAAASVSQCGYNTALDVLRARVPALVVPFSAPGEDEQTRRAQRLAALGAVRALHPRELDGPALAREIRALLGAEPPAVDLDLDGAAASAELLARMVAAGLRPEAARARA